MPRRSLSIEDGNHARILEFRGKLMIKGIDADYTTTLNLIIGAGADVMNSVADGVPADAHLWGHIKQVVENPEQKSVGLMDEIMSLQGKEMTLRKKN